MLTNIECPKNNRPGRHAGAIKGFTVGDIPHRRFFPEVREARVGRDQAGSERKPRYRVLG